MEEATILVKYHDDIEHIAEIEGGDWFDLRVAEDVTLEFIRKEHQLRRVIAFANSES